MEPAGGSGCGVNYFELYPGDYLKATQRLTLLEHGAYLRLLMAYYGEEEPLPADLGELFVTVSAISAADKAAVKKVADRFFPVAADGLRHNDRADAEIEKAQRRIAAAKANGSKGGRKPKANPNPAETQRVSQWATQPLTQSGEALHAPHATTETEDSVATPPPAAGPADRVGQFECHDHPEATPNPVAPFAIALNSLGLPDCTGKPAAYAIRIARRELTERAPTITGVTHESARVRGNGRRLSAVEQVEHAIAERQQREAAAGRTFDA
jgi:uncharacterized protein YdaU (DUF1376 family)